MSGNGGRPSSLQAATSGSPPFDPGPRTGSNQPANGRHEAVHPPEVQPSQASGFHFSPGHFDTDEGMQEDIPSARNEAHHSVSTTSFSAGIRSLFPMGINQPRSSLNTDPVIITPQAGVPSRAQRQHIPGLESVDETREVEIISTTDRNGVIIQGNDFRRASKMLRQEEAKILKMLPEQVQPELSSIKTYTFLAELHFNKPISEKGVKMDNSEEFNVITCLGSWIKRTREIAPDLVLHSYRDESGGNPITHEEQLPKDDSDAINLYFHNHRVDNSGILKGMIRFSASVPWMQLKDQRRPYFKWLSNNRIFLRRTGFDADSISLLGYLHGSHPDAARLVDMTNELKIRLQLPDDIDFQLTPRNLFAIDSQATKTKFSFKAIAVETDSKMAGPLREAFFRLGDPKVAKHKWPVTGNCLFVPMFKTASWTTETISAMAKVHSRNMAQLEQIFVENVHDIDTPVTFREPGGSETSRTLRMAIQLSTNQAGDDNVVHSVHTTNRAGVIRILVTNANAEHAKQFFSQLQDHLRATLSAEDLDIITKGKLIQLTDRIYESSDSKTYAGFAEAILRENPQDGSPQDYGLALPSPQRKKTRMELSYSNIAKRALETPTGGTDAPTQEGAEIGDWEQRIQASFQNLFGDHPPLRAEDVESKMQEAINKQAQESEARLDRRFRTFSAEMQNFTSRENEKSKRMIQTMFEKQNQLFLNLTTQMQHSLLKLDENIKDIAFQTNATILHMETPRIDVRNTSPVAQRQDATESAGLSDAAT